MTWFLLVVGLMLAFFLRELLAGLVIVAVAFAAIYTVVASIADFNGGGPNIDPTTSIMP
jgi:hypothetical protein